MEVKNVLLDELERRLTQRGALYALAANESDGPPGFAHGPRTLTDLFSMLARRGDRQFIISNERSYSFLEVSQMAAAGRDFLTRQHGLRANERVGLAASNQPDWIIWFFAILAGGGVPVLVSAFSPDKLLDQVGLAGCRIVIADAGARATLANGEYDGCVIALECRAALCATLLALEAVSPVSGRRDREALIAFTSGSTGTAKAISQSHLGITTGLMNMMLAGALASEGFPKPAQAAPAPCALIVAPLSHSIGYTPLLMAALMGTRVALPASDELADIAAVVEGARVTAIMGLDRSRLDRLLWRNDAAQMLNTIRTWNFAGNELQPALLERILAATPNAILSSGYGLAETNGGICAITGNDLLRGDGAVGRVVPTTAIKIVDADGHAVTPGERGLVWLRGDMLMRGYLGRDGELIGVEDGWFCTGDEGALSQERRLAIFGRHDPAANSGCEVSLAGLERWARNQKHVVDACAIRSMKNGAPHCFLFVQPAAALQMQTLLPPTQSGSAMHVSVLECRDFPRTGTGKVDRASLRWLAETNSALLGTNESRTR